MGTGVLRRIAVVEGNEALRLGIGALAERDPGLVCAGVFSPADATERAPEIAACDAVLVAGILHAGHRSAHDHSEHDHSEHDRGPIDELGGVSAAELVRAAAGAAAPLLVVYAAVPDHPALRLRAREAGADAVVPSADVTSAERLSRVVRWRREACSITPPQPSPELRSLGVSSRSQINAFVRRAQELGLAEMLDQGTEDLGSRRQIRHIRAELAGAGRIDAANTDGAAPRRDQTLPSIRQLQRLYRWATRLDPD